MRVRKDRACSGQMAVELAVLMPVVIVVALTVYNLARFVSLCATFDRVSVDAVTVVGVSPKGTQNSVHAVEEVKRSIEHSMGPSSACEVEVRAEPVGANGGGGILSLGPALTRFTCSLAMRPWPSAFVMAGVRYEAPLVLRHERTLVVDRYRSGVVM